MYFKITRRAGTHHDKGVFGGVVGPLGFPKTTRRLEDRSVPGHLEVFVDEGIGSRM